MYIFRVENDENKGPYIGVDQTTWRCFGGGKRMPEPSINVIGSNIFFGFYTERQLRKWFLLEELDILRGMGFRVKKVRIKKTDIVYDDGKQIGFHYTKFPSSDFEIMY